jgi:hypothetical protein
MKKTVPQSGGRRHRGTQSLEAALATLRAVVTQVDASAGALPVILQELHDGMTAVDNLTAATAQGRGVFMDLAAIRRTRPAPAGRNA